MSYKNFEKSLELAKKCDYYKVGGGTDRNIIDRAERILDINFSKQLKDYLIQYGYVDFNGVEIYGIINNDIDDYEIPYPNIVQWSMNERENYKLPKQWLPIKFEDDGYTSFLDFSNLNADQEPPVILGIYNGEEYIKVEVMAQDLGDFLLQLVQEALEDQ